MKGALEFLSNLYWLSLPETVAGTLWHADWEGAYRRAGLLGLATEFGHSLFGTNSWPFFVPLDSTWSGGEIEGLLKQYGIEVWGQDFHNGELFFRVRKAKAPWAEHLLLKAGVPLQHRRIGQRASAMSPRAGDSIPARTEPARASLSDQVEATEQRLSAMVDSLTSLIDG